MKRITLLLLLSSFFALEGRTQCNVTITASTTTLPCGGGPVTLTANGSGYSTTPINNDFDAGNAGPGWNVSPAGQFNNPCDPSFDGGTYMWMGNTTAAPRTLETAPLDLSCGGDICFWLDFATQGGAAPCEGPDIVGTEGVYLEYSIDGGATWVTINYFQPNPGGGAGAITQWNQYCFPIPAAAMTASTLIHWYQGGSSGTCCDHWGIDNVVITATGCGNVWYDWDNIPGTTGPAGDPQTQTVNVVSDTTFTVCFTDGAGFNCCETIAITVNGMGAPNVAPVDETCLGFNDGSVTVTPNGGVGGYTYNLVAGPSAPMTNTNGNFTGLAPGNYTVDVVDNGSNCTASTTFTINPGIVCCPSPINLSTTDSDLQCYQDNSGQIIVNASGGDGGPYQYSIDGGVTYSGNNTFTGLAAGNHTFDVIDNSGCIGQISTTLNEPTQLTSTSSTIDASCNGSCDGQIFLAPSGGTPQYTYTWLPAGTAPNNAAQASNLCAGTYDVTIVDQNNCTFTINGITINEPASMGIQNITTTDELCSGACDGTITITEPNAVQFTIDDGFTQTTQTNGNFTNICAGTYTVIVEDATGCQATGTATVSSPNQINITPGSDTTICENGTANISANANGGTAPLTYYWDNGLPTGQIQSVNPAVNTVYNVYVEDANGCQSQTVSITVTINPPLQVTALSDQAICPGQSAQISALGQGGDGSLTYSWSDGTNTFNGQFQTVTPATTTTYTVTLDDGCETTSVTDQITITVNPLPVVQFSGDTLEGCMPVTTNFSNDTDPNLTGQCLWNFGDGNFSSDCNPTHTYSDAGCYDVTLTVTSPDGCVSNASQTNMICVYEYPVAGFTFGPQPTTVVSPTIQFTNASSGAVSYEWDFGYDGQTSNAVNPEFEYPYTQPGNYNVCLLATNADGCQDSICQVVYIDDEFLIYVPNAFTPDGDGINDVFQPYINGIEVGSYTLMIFDRWGELIWQTNSETNFWDGSINGSTANMKDDVYVWKITLTDATTNEKKEFYGHVTLLR